MEHFKPKNSEILNVLSTLFGEKDFISRESPILANYDNITIIIGLKSWIFQKLIRYTRPAWRFFEKK